jgi:hypothetical protein
MVFCRQCKRKVEDCPHCVFPIQGPRVRVYDEKVETLVYVYETRTLQIHFRSGQSWQLFDVPDGIYKELRESTISSFLKFIAQRYRAAPVKQGIHAIAIPPSELCAQCTSPMTQSHKVAAAVSDYVRVEWTCPACNKSEWKMYGSEPERTRKERWH